MAGPEEASAAAMAAAQALVGVAVRSLAPALQVLTLQQYRVLVLIQGRGPLPSGVLAADLGVHRSTFSRTVDRLEAGGWARRQDSPSSRREVLVDLTDSGRDLVGAVLQRREQEMRAILGSLDDADRDLVLLGLQAFATAAERVGAEPADLVSSDTVTSLPQA